MSSIYECQTIEPCTEWQEYSRRKSEWIKQHPGATTEEYDAAIRAIVDELGI